MGRLKVLMIVMGVVLGLNGIVQIMTGNMQSGLTGLVVGLAAVAVGIFMLGTKWKTPMSEQEPLSHAQPKHSGIGIASFVISIAAGVLMFVTSVVAGVMVASTPGGPGGMVKESAEFMMVGFAVVGLLIADLVALGLGIGGLF